MRIGVGRDDGVKGQLALAGEDTVVIIQDLNAIERDLDPAYLAVARLDHHAALGGLARGPRSAPKGDRRKLVFFWKIQAERVAAVEVVDSHERRKLLAID